MFISSISNQSIGTKSEFKTILPGKLSVQKPNITLSNTNGVFNSSDSEISFTEWQDVLEEIETKTVKSKKTESLDEDKNTIKTEETNSEETKSNERKVEDPAELEQYGIDAFDIEDKDVFISTGPMNQTVIKIKDKDGKIRTGYIYSKDLDSYTEYQFDSNGNPKSASRYKLLPGGFGGPSSETKCSYPVATNPESWFFYAGDLDGYQKHLPKFLNFLN